MPRPHLWVLGDLLSHDECDTLVALALRQQPPSRGGDDARLARGQTALVRRIEHRMAALLRWPLTHCEALHVARCGQGAPAPLHPGAEMGTLVLVLAAPPQGAAVRFGEQLLDVAPSKGQGVFFAHPPRPAAPALDGGMWVATMRVHREPVA